jgi:hypothetical protein
VDHLHSVLLVGGAAGVGEVELVDIDLPARRKDAESLAMPVHHLLHAFDHIGDSVLLGAPRRTGDAEWLVPAARPCPERIDPWERSEVVHVEVTEEDVVQLVDRDAGSQVVGDGALPKVEDEGVAVPELDVDGGVHLARPEHGSRTHEGDPHLIRLDVLGARKPVGGALQPGLGLDALEQEALLPATHRHTAREDALDDLRIRLVLRLLSLVRDHPGLRGVGRPNATQQVRGHETRK